MEPASVNIIDLTCGVPMYLVMFCDWLEILLQLTVGKLAENINWRYRWSERDINPHCITHQYCSVLSTPLHLSAVLVTRYQLFITAPTLQTRFYVGAGGNCPSPKPRPYPKSDMKYCLMQKAAFCGLQNTPKWVSDRGWESSRFSPRFHRTVLARLYWHVLAGLYPAFLRTLDIFVISQLMLAFIVSCLRVYIIGRQFDKVYSLS